MKSVMNKIFIKSCTPVAAALLLSLAVPNATQAQLLETPKPIAMQISELAKAGYDIQKYLSENLKFPQEFKDAKQVDIRCVIEFEVTEMGKIKIKEVQGVAGTIQQKKVDQTTLDLFKNEAVKVIENMPDWKPGTKDGKPMSTYLTVPIVFKS